MIFSPFFFWKLKKKSLGSAPKNRVGRETGNKPIFFFWPKAIIIINRKKFFFQRNHRYRRTSSLSHPNRNRRPDFRRMSIHSQLHNVFQQPRSLRVCLIIYISIHLISFCCSRYNRKLLGLLLTKHKNTQMISNA